MTLPAGFRIQNDLLVNDGPTDAAAGRFVGESEPVLWSRQVLTDGRLRAVAVTKAAEGPDLFQAVHATAERVAHDLGIGAVEVAVWWAESIGRHALRLTSTGWAVAGFGTGDLALLVTDADVSAEIMSTALATAWPADNALVLSSGLAVAAPSAAEFAATVSALRLDLVCPKGGAA
jgi:glutamate N-acetyltransferase/amino-acid N-acetyltransferase